MDFLEDLYFYIFELNEIMKRLLITDNQVDTKQQLHHMHMLYGKKTVELEILQHVYYYICHQYKRINESAKLDKNMEEKHKELVDKTIHTILMKLNVNLHSSNESPRFKSADPNTEEPIDTKKPTVTGDMTLFSDLETTENSPNSNLPALYSNIDDSDIEYFKRLKRSRSSKKAPRIRLVLSNSKNLEFPCERCGKKYLSKRSLTRHNLQVHEKVPRNKEKIYKCEECKQHFYGASRLRFHVEAEHRKIRYPCLHCDKTFKSEYILKEHMKLHNGTAPSCPECGKSFESKRKFNRHLKVHKNDVLICKFCDVAIFKNKKLFSFHIKQHTSEFKCVFCMQNFTSKMELLTHRKQLHDNVYFQCDICNKTLRKKAALRSHLISFHSQNGIEENLSLLMNESDVLKNSLDPEESAAEFYMNEIEPSISETDQREKIYNNNPKEVILSETQTELLL